ncbi:MAG: hypothetical protein HY270_14430 [Deltaproteobacteria bacterium]|nr:hypothetical protein [Deltaproteobacteria bacterium]
MEEPSGRSVRHSILETQIGRRLTRCYQNIKMRRLGSWLLAAILVAFFLVRFVPPANAGQVACSDVIKKVNHRISLERGNSPDLSLVAHQVGSSVPWVEHCMKVYGRRPKRPGLESAEAHEERLEAFEDDEPEETGPEDVEEEGAKERREHPERPRYSKFKNVPAPEPGSPEDSKGEE